MQRQDNSLGFIGLGRMGREILPRINFSFPVKKIYNRSPEKYREIENVNAGVAKSPGEVARECNVIFLSLTDSSAVKSVIFGENGLTGELKKGTIIVDLSTISLETTVEVSRKLQLQDVAYLDCPVIGSIAAARSGTLTAVCGGDETLFNQIKPILSAFAAKAFYLGSSGNGTRVKLINNMVMGINMGAISESLELAGQEGIDPEILLEILLSGGAASRILELKKRKILNSSFEAEFSLEHQLKDIRYGLEMAKSAGLDLSLSKTAERLFSLAMDRGYGKLDESAVAMTTGETGKKDKPDKEANP